MRGGEASDPKGRSLDKRALVCLIFIVILVPRFASAQVQLGQKILGGIGINAGVQSLPGLYLIDRLALYDANTIKDNDGNTVRIPGLDIDARGNMLGFALTIKPKPKHSPYVSFAAGAPLARVSINSDLPQTASIDRSGFGDIFVQPLKLGWRETHFDVVAVYTFYAPTGKFEPRRLGNVGRGFWTNQLSLGGAVFPKRDKSLRASVLASYDFNGKKKGIDIQRGNSLQLQGGAGVVVKQVLTLGVAGFTLWQVTDDEGRDIPPALRNLTTRVYGIGPEIDLLIPRLRMQAEARWEHEFGARSRTQGNVFIAGLSYRAWQPRKQSVAKGR
jgi:hypothetical protein